MFLKANEDIRRFIRAHDVKTYEVARHLGVHENTLLRWLRDELPEDKREAIKTAVAELAEEQNRIIASIEADKQKGEADA
ncbi:MAG: hypothetical protein E7190_07360 [Erysipelotrichaceae bacterium]|nr:hypothetical protein [Erysipelotrichaceae bacterium]